MDGNQRSITVLIKAPLGDIMGSGNGGGRQNRHLPLPVFFKISAGKKRGKYIKH
jgi:hypothetical protein